MKFQIFTLPTIPATFEERRALRPIGRNTERYQAMLEELRELVVLADEAGFDCFSTTEHHFHSEGFEASVQPMMLYADLAARTKNISFAPCALVLPGNDPIRVAEQIAVLDQLTKGRVYGGFARGYQDRWVNILGQQVPVQGSPMNGNDIDKRNRAVHEEYIEIIYKAWSNDVLTHNGEFYQVPFPYEEGITRWPLAEWTNEYGAPGEIDENGVIRGVSVIPAPYQKPYPRIFQAFSTSESTIRQTARDGNMPLILIADPAVFTKLCHTYRDVASEHGRDLKIGESLGAMRSVTFGDTEDQAVEMLRNTNYWGFQKYFAGFGFWEAFRTPADNVKYGKRVPLPKAEWTMDRFRGSKYALAGTIDQVKRDIEAVATIHGEGELEWFSWFFDQGLMPLSEAKRQLEIFAEHIIPEFM
jgi:alkanesulfonate monooxygenase SsuD/methylene tetrahydromethanopterin reductase-like flavin-dependent oxidoreductase (luciferase family)